MINYGLSLTVAALGFALIGALGYMTARRTASRSRWAALTIFGHLSLLTSGALLVATAVHIHPAGPFSIHLHALHDGLAQVFACDLDLSCGIFTAGVVSFLVLASTFGIAQGSARLLLRKLSKLQDPNGLERLRALLPASTGNTEFLVVGDSEPDAFAFALLRADRGRLARATSVVVLTRGLMDLLEPDELEAAIAHELAHVRARDDRYLPYFRTLASIIFFDPVLRSLNRRVSRRHEFAADREAALQTGRPRALARALLKVYLHPHAPASAAGFAGESRSELLARIEALLEIEESWGRDGSPRPTNRC